jgi:hypothetical protein
MTRELGDALSLKCTVSQLDTFYSDYDFLFVAPVLLTTVDSDDTTQRYEYRTAAMAEPVMYFYQSSP